MPSTSLSASSLVYAAWECCCDFSPIPKRARRLEHKKYVESEFQEAEIANALLFRLASFCCPLHAWTANARNSSFTR